MVHKNKKREFGSNQSIVKGLIDKHIERRKFIVRSLTWINLKTDLKQLCFKFYLHFSLFTLFDSLLVLTQKLFVW